MGRRILLIDDDDLLRATVTMILEAAGYEVAQARDGVEGAEKFRASRPDLVITDILMPRKEGIETIRELRQVDQDARIIAISGGDRTGHPQYLRMAERLGADRVLAKPFRKAVLLATVEELLGAAAVPGALAPGVL